MTTHPRTVSVLRFALTPMLVGFAALVCNPWRPANPTLVSYVFLAAVVASAWVAGRTAGLTAALLAALTLDYFFLPPLHTLGIGREAMPYMVPFLLGSFAAAWMSAVYRQAEEARAHNLRLRTAVEQAAQGIIITDRKGTIQYVNQASTAMTGYTAAELLGQNPRLLKSKQQDPQFYARLWETILAGRVWQGELINRRKDNTFYTERMTIAPVRSRKSEIVGFIALKEDVTQRIVLEERQAFLAAIVENSADAIVTCTPGGIIRSWNNGAQQLLGYSPEEVLGRPIWDIVAPEWHGEIEADIQRAANGHGGSAREQVWLSKDGIRRDVQAHGFPIMNRDGAIVAVGAILHDITDRRRAEEAILRSHELAQSTIDALPTKICVLDETGTIVSVNRAWREFATGDTPVPAGGESQDLGEGANYLELCDRASGPGAEQAAEFAAGIRAVLRAEADDFTAEYACDSASGRRWFLGGVTRFFEEGRPRIVVNHIDISERRRMEVELREANDRLLLATRAGSVGVWELDIRSDRIVWDEQMFRLYGVARDQFHGNHEDWLRCLHPADRDRLMAESAAAIRGEREHDSEFRVVWADGSVHTIRALGQVQRDAAGKALRMIGTNWDMTPQKEAARELEQRNLLLKEAMERSERLTAEAARANSAKSDFLATMSHEIRTPMNGVIGMTGLLLDTDLTSEQRHYAEAAHDCGESLLRIINDILDFSKIEAGKLKLEEMEFDLFSLVEDVATVVAVQAQSKGLELCFFVDPVAPARLIGDPGRLRQILVNLLGNAVKFTTRGEVNIRASVDSETETDCLIRLSVRDSGIGIPEEKMDLLFEEFSQVDSTNTREFGGTGLGLAISKRLSEQMGGHIGVQSEEGVGSEFWVTVRLRKATHDRESQHSASDEGLTGVRLLVVDDSATARTAVCSLAKHWGMRPLDISSGPLALQAIYDAVQEGDPFTIALIDLDMPGMGGQELCHVIRGNPRLCDTQLVLMKIFAQLADPLGHSLDSNFFVTKPIRPRELRHAFLRVLANGQVSIPAGKRENLNDPQVVAEPGFEHSTRILLAEDNYTNREVALAILKKFGLRADAVVNGAQAVKALETESYDLVLMDIRMPGIDGLEATRRIRDPRSAVLNHAVPVIALTATVLESEKKLCLDAGMNGFVTKPVIPATLRAELSRYLGPQARAKNSKPKDRLEETAASTRPCVFDREGLLGRTMLDRQLAKAVIAAFLRDFSREVAELRASLERGDRVSAARSAHSLKGAAASAGAAYLSGVALEMQAAADAGDLFRVRQALEELETSFSQFREVVEDSDLLRETSG